MKKYFAIVIKEVLQLVRDWPGLAILFVMPAVMLIVITLTQETVMIGRESGMRIIIVNADSSALGNSIENELKTKLQLTQVTYASEKDAEKEVFKGEFQMMVLIPYGATEKLLVSARIDPIDTSRKIENQAGITLLYDPAVMKVYKDMLAASIHMIIESAAMRIFMEARTEALETDINRQVENFMKKIPEPDFENAIPDFPQKKQVVQQFRSALEKHAGEKIQLDLPEDIGTFKALVRIEEIAAGDRSYNLKPDIVKNNVPAFILFAMFFIVIPLAGSIISEKQQGTKDRLMTLPVSGFTFFSGKITVFLLVCVLQFFVMIGIGKYLFPLISRLPALSMDVDLPALILVIIASALAAIGFGLLIGTVSSTYGQAAPLGSVIVVILAILGGIFVPVFMMPEFIRKISIISPLRWGTDAFFSIFARGAGIGVILPQLMSLLVFFGIALFISATVFAQRK